MFHNSFAATTLASLCALHGAGILQAEVIAAPLVLQPLEAIGVAAGQTKTVGYFVVEDGSLQACGDDGHALDLKCHEGAQSLVVENADSMFSSPSRGAPETNPIADAEPP